MQIPRVFVGRLPRNCRKDELQKLFEKEGSIRDISLKEGYGFIVCVN